MKPLQLRNSEYGVLVEALRRRSRFFGNPSGGPSIIEQWTGLGSANTYRQAVEAGYMICAADLNLGYDTWWKLTEKGARIISFWIGQGWNHTRIEAGDWPLRQIPAELR